MKGISEYGRCLWRSAPTVIWVEVDELGRRISEPLPENGGKDAMTA